jgi:hypothetical protein
MFKFENSKQWVYHVLLQIHKFFSFTQQHNSYKVEYDYNYTLYALRKGKVPKDLESCIKTVGGTNNK